MTAVYLGIPFEEMPSLKLWLDGWIAHGIKACEPIFREIHRSGRVQPTRLAGDAVRRIIKRRMAEYMLASGRSAADALLLARDYSGHSLRRGYCSTASEARLSLGEIRVRFAAQLGYHVGKVHSRCRSLALVRGSAKGWGSDHARPHPRRACVDAAALR
jgi:hypothetical protein